MPSNILRFPTPLRLVRHEAIEHWLERHQAILEGRRYTIMIRDRDAPQELEPPAFNPDDLPSEIPHLEGSDER